MRRISPAAAGVTSFLLFALPAWGCGSPTDAISSGSLCSPPTRTCPAEVRLSRDSGGRNLFDIALENRGPEATATLDISLDSQGERDAADGFGGSDTGPPRRTGTFPVEYRLSSGDRVEDRFTSTELFSVSDLFVELDCEACPDCGEPCEVRANYVFLAADEECVNDDECPGEKICDEPAGHCVECLDDGDCGVEQTCEQSSGRCRPPEEGGCRQSGGPPPVPVTPVLVVGLFVGIRRSLGGSLPPALGSCALALLFVALPAEARTAPPGSTFSIGAGPRWVAGPLGDDVRRGIGAELRETVRWRFGGISAWVTANYFVTDQPSPPLIRELQIFGFGIGPRAFYPVGPVELMAGAGYQRLGFAPNPLVRRTDDESNFNAVGGSVGVGYQWSQFVVRLSGDIYPILGRNGTFVSATLSFGISTR